MFNFSNHVYLVVSNGVVKATELKSGAFAEINLPSSTHPRTPMGSFEETEKAFTQILNKVSPKSFFRPSPIAYVHLIDIVEGGYTDVELRAFKEAVLGAGARDVYMPDSSIQLTKEQLLNKQFVQYEKA